MIIQQCISELKRRALFMVHFLANSSSWLAKVPNKGSRLRVSCWYKARFMLVTAA